jgi:RNA polymerase sigma-70 factor (ECF subfamily)
MLSAARKAEPPAAARLEAATAEAASIAEAALIGELRRGDQAAAREFYDRYAARLHRFIFHALPADLRADAEDLLQETFMALAEALPYFRGECSLTTFACAIARRKVAGFVRSNARRTRLAPDQALASEQPAGEADAAGAASAALDTLSGEHREVLLLKYVEELSVAQIAAILRLSEHAVESRLARARRSLAKRLGIAK